MGMTYSYAIVLYDRVFEQYRCYNENGYAASPFRTLEEAQRKVKEWGYTEVYVNSKIGRQILAKIGVRR